MAEIPDHTAVRTALWRALHLQADAAPHVLEDEVGLRLIAPADDWRKRQDMDPEFTRFFRASIVARARFIEDLAIECATKKGIEQYVILGAGLDTFAQRKPKGVKLKIFEIDKPETQAWKRQRLKETGLGIADELKFVPVDFEAGSSWKMELGKSGFDSAKPALIVSTGVSMYLTREANAATLREVASFAPGSIFAMTYLIPMEHADPEERFGRELAEKGARASGTPFISFFTAEDVTRLARESGFPEVSSVPAAELNRRYFANRNDGLRTSKSEEILVAKR